MFHAVIIGDFIAMSTVILLRNHGIFKITSIPIMLFTYLYKCSHVQCTYTGGLYSLTCGQLFSGVHPLSGHPCPLRRGFDSVQMSTVFAQPPLAGRSPPVLEFTTIHEQCGELST